MNVKHAACFAAIAALLGVAPNVCAITCQPYWGQEYKEDFNSLASSGTSSALPPGWALIETGTNADTTYAVGDGNAATGNTYSFGNSADRALGAITDANVRSVFGVCLINATGKPIASVDVSLSWEQWRAVPCAFSSDRRTVSYSVDATALNNGTWTSEAALGIEVAGLGNASGAVDGNMYSSSKSATVNLISPWTPNSTLFLRMTQPISLTECRGNGLAVDDFKLARPPMCDLDIDGNGQVDPLTDAVLSMRAMFGLTGAAVTSGAVGANAGRNDWNRIRTFLNYNCGTNYLP